MARIIAVASTKGGVGKTTLAVNLAIEAARAGGHVLLVDSDRQGSAADWAENRPDELLRLPTIRLDQPRTLLRELPDLAADRDLVFIDCGGRDSVTLRNALSLANLVVVPLRPGGLDLWSTLTTLELAASSTAAPVRILLNMVRTRRLADEAMALLSQQATPPVVLKSRIVERVAWATAAGEGFGVRELEPSGKAAHELEAICRELNIPITRRPPTKATPPTLTVIEGGIPA